jgi:hypothetical protein
MSSLVNDPPRANEHRISSGIGKNNRPPLDAEEDLGLHTGLLKEVFDACDDPNPAELQFLARVAMMTDEEMRDWCKYIRTIRV